jgi:protoheme IX farnesyltransferase
MTALYMFMIVFFWTPPHFWALALRLGGDYGRANVPMLPHVRGRSETARQILLYSVVLTAITLLLGLRGFGPFYMFSALGLGAGLIWLSTRVLRDSGTTWARRTFEYSLVYLALLFAAMVVDVLLRT